MKKIIITLTIGIAVVLLASGCAYTTKKVSMSNYSTTELMNYAESVLNEEELSRFAIPYKITPELVTMAKQVANRSLPDTEIARKLALLLLEEGTGLGVTYSRNKNYTATEVYQHRQANCISYTNLFIGMARSIGLNADYVEVTEVDSFDKVGGMVVYNSHICAVVFSGPRPFIIDFSLRRYPQYHSWRTITDVEAAASFYNNIGSYHFLTNDSWEGHKEADIYYNMAMKLDPNFAQAFNNKGVLEMKRLNYDVAEQYYRKALTLKPGYFAAYSNLGNIYSSRGDYDKAIELIRTAIKESPDNLYAYITLAKIHLKLGHLENAELELTTALNKNKKFTEARHMLGQLYLRMGRSSDAKEQFALALKYQPDDDIAVNKMDLIERLFIARADKSPQ